MDKISLLDKINHLKKNALLTSKKYTWLKRADKILRFSNKNFIKKRYSAKKKQKDIEANGKPFHIPQNKT